MWKASILIPKIFMLKISAWERAAWILFINMFTIDIEKKYKPIEMCRHFLLSALEYPYYNPGGYLKIQHTKKRPRSHFNYMNGRYYVQKSDLEVILMIGMGDTTYKKNVFLLLFALLPHGTS